MCGALGYGDGCGGTEWFKRVTFVNRWAILSLTPVLSLHCTDEIREIM